MCDPLLRLGMAESAQRASGVAGRQVRTGPDIRTHDLPPSVALSGASLHPTKHVGSPVGLGDRDGDSDVDGCDLGQLVLNVVVGVEI
jgi:hypothetical protein